MSTLRFLITAGPTREPLDPVRYLSNDSSGRMGVALAEAAVERRHRVHLVAGPLSVPIPPEIPCTRVTTAREMLTACRRLWPAFDVLIMAAAVCDYRPARTLTRKHKRSTQPWTLTLVPNPDIVAELAARRRPDQLVIGFALEDRDARRRAEQKLRSKGLDAVVLNGPAAIGAGQARFELLVSGGRWQILRETHKPAVARRLIRLAERLHARNATRAPASAGRPGRDGSRPVRGR